MARAFELDGSNCQNCTGGKYYFSRYCGAYVCDKCNHHRGLGSCYCGWGLRRGERLEDDIGDSHFDGEDWHVEY